MDQATKERNEELAAAIKVIEEMLDERPIGSAEDYAEARNLRDSLDAEIRAIPGNDFVAARAGLARLADRVRTMMREYEDGPVIVNGRPL